MLRFDFDIKLYKGFRSVLWSQDGAISFIVFWNSS